MLYNVASCWLYLKEYIDDARSHERQTLKHVCATYIHIRYQTHTTRVGVDAKILPIYGYLAS